MHRTKLLVAIVVGTSALATLKAGGAAPEGQQASDRAKQSSAAFERLKTLSGDWQFAAPTDADQKGKTIARYRVTAAGSAFEETLFPGQHKEMITIYHRDGDQLVLTHYCTCGNQPRMRTATCDSKDELVFEFAGATNLDASRDMYMHGYRIRFVDADRIHAECEFYQDGKPAGKHTLDLVRKKA
jgi:hypothetical protein